MASTASSDHHLLEAWRTGRDETAFRILCQRHVGLVAATARRLGSPDADEAGQAVFLLLSRRAQSVDGARLAGWLVGTARRVVAHQRRAAARRRRHEQEAAMHHVPLQPSAAAEAPWLEARPYLDDALASLSPARREAVTRFHLQGRSQAEVAAELGCSVDAVKTRVHEGLERLRVFFVRRGVALGAAAIASGLASESASAEPALAARCAQAALAPGTATAAAAIVQGVATAMIIKTTAIAVAAAILAATCLTAAWGLAGEPSPPAPQPAATTTAAAAPADPSANAALVWWRAFDAMPGEDDPTWDTVDRALSAPKNVPDPDLDALFTRPHPLDLFALGASRPYCAWGIDSETEGVSAPLPYVNKIRRLTRLIALRARWHVSRGEGAAAVDDLLTGLRSARIYPGLQPLLVDWLVGISNEAIAIAAAGAIAPQLQPEQRQRLAAALATLPSSSSLADCLDQEVPMVRCIINRLLALPYDQRIKTASALGGIDVADPAHTAMMATDANLQAVLARHPIEIARWQAYLRLPPAQRLLPITPLYSTGDQTPFPMISMLCPAVNMLGAKEIRRLVLHAQLRAALAYLDQGEAGLAQYPDPLTGQPFPIEQTATGFRLRVSIAGQQKPCELAIGETDGKASPSSEPETPTSIVPSPF